MGNRQVDHLSGRTVPLSLGPGGAVVRSGSADGGRRRRYGLDPVEPHLSPVRSAGPWSGPGAPTDAAAVHTR